MTQKTPFDRNSFHDLAKHLANLLGHDESAFVDMAIDQVYFGHKNIDQMRWLLQKQILQARKAQYGQ